MYRTADKMISVTILLLAIGLARIHYSTDPSLESYFKAGRAFEIIERILHEVQPDRMALFVQADRLVEIRDFLSKETIDEIARLKINGSGILENRSFYLDFASYTFILGETRVLIEVWV